MGNALTSDAAPVCCPVCSPDTENGRAEPADTVPTHRASSSPTGTEAGPAGTLAAALALIADLPLTPTEKADAVRRLLAADHAALVRTAVDAGAGR